MGYRLCVEQIQRSPQVYGTKLYGYVDDVTKLKSFQWLADHNKIDPEEDRDCWDCYASMDIRLKASEFREFIKLYAEDLKENYDGPMLDIMGYTAMQSLYNSDNDKIISWG